MQQIQVQNNLTTTTLIDSFIQKVIPNPMLVYTTQFLQTVMQRTTRTEDKLVLCKWSQSTNFICVYLLTLNLHLIQMNSSQFELDFVQMQVTFQLNKSIQLHYVVLGDNIFEPVTYFLMKRTPNKSNQYELFEPEMLLSTFNSTNQELTPLSNCITLIDKLITNKELFEWCFLTKGASLLKPQFTIGLQLYKTQQQTNENNQELQQTNNQLTSQLQQVDTPLMFLTPLQKQIIADLAKQINSAESKLIVLKVPTGFGKTTILLQALQECKQIQYVVVLNRTVQQAKQWKTEFNKWNLQDKCRMNVLVSKMNTCLNQLVINSKGKCNKQVKLKCLHYQQIITNQQRNTYSYKANQLDLEDIHKQRVQECPYYESLQSVKQQRHGQIKSKLIISCTSALMTNPDYHPDQFNSYYIDFLPKEPNPKNVMFVFDESHNLFRQSSSNQNKLCFKFTSQDKDWQSKLPTTENNETALTIAGIKGSQLKTELVVFEELGSALFKLGNPRVVHHTNETNDANMLRVLLEVMVKTKLGKCKSGKFKRKFLFRAMDFEINYLITNHDEQVFCTIDVCNSDFTALLRNLPWTRFQLSAKYVFVSATPDLKVIDKYYPGSKLISLDPCLLSNNTNVDFSVSSDFEWQYSEWQQTSESEKSQRISVLLQSILKQRNHNQGQNKTTVIVINTSNRTNSLLVDKIVNELISTNSQFQNMCVHNEFTLKQKLMPFIQQLKDERQSEQTKQNDYAIVAVTYFGGYFTEGFDCPTGLVDCILQLGLPFYNKNLPSNQRLESTMKQPDYSKFQSTNNSFSRHNSQYNQMRQDEDSEQQQQQDFIDCDSNPETESDESQQSSDNEDQTQQDNTYKEFDIYQSSEVIQYRWSYALDKLVQLVGRMQRNTWCFQQTNRERCLFVISSKLMYLFIANNKQWVFQKRQLSYWSECVNISQFKIEY